MSDISFELTSEQILVELPGASVLPEVADAAAAVHADALAAAASATDAEASKAAIQSIATIVPTPVYSTAVEALDASVAFGIEAATGDARFLRIRPEAIDQMPTRGYVTRREFNRVKFRAQLLYTSWLGQSKMQTSAVGAPHNTTQRYGMLAFPFHTAAIVTANTSSSAGSGSTSLAFATNPSITPEMLIAVAGVPAGTTVLSTATGTGTTTVTLSAATTAAIASGVSVTFTAQVYPLLGNTQQVNGTTDFLGTTVGGESPMHGSVYAGEYAERVHGVKLDQINLIMLDGNNATGSTSLAQNARGGNTGNFEHTIAQVELGMNIALAMGLEFSADGNMWWHSEGGDGTGNSPPNGVGYTYTGYKNAHKAHAVDIDVSTRAITGDPKPVHLFCVQTNTPTGGAATAWTNDPFNMPRATLDAYREYAAAPNLIVLGVTNASSAANTNTLSLAANPAIAVGMVVSSGTAAPLSSKLVVQAVSTTGGTTTVTLSGNIPIGLASGAAVSFNVAPIVAVTPEYMCGFANSLHVPSREANWIGSYLKLAKSLTSIEGVPYKPLTFVVDKIIRNRVCMLAVGNEGPIVIDRTFINPQDDAAQGMISGVTCRDTSNAIIKVGAVGRYGTEGWYADLVDGSGNPLALSSTIGANGYDLKYALNKAVGRGPYVGGCGNIHDSMGDRIPMFRGNGVNRRMDKWAMADQWRI